MKLEKFRQIIAAFGCALILTCGLANFATAQQTDSKAKLTAEVERVIRQMNDAFIGREAKPDANKKTVNLDFEMGAVPATKQ